MSDQTQEKLDLALQSMTREQLLEKARADNHPWLPAIGIFEEGTIFDQWQQAIEDYRQSVDEDPKSL